MTAMMPVRVETPGPTFQELPDSPPPSGAAGDGVIKKLENRIDKRTLSSTSALALGDKPADVPAPALASNPALAPALASTSALALEDEPAADERLTANDLRLRIMSARMDQAGERKARVSFFPIRGGDNRPESLSRR